MLISVLLIAAAAPAGSAPGGDAAPICRHTVSPADGGARGVHPLMDEPPAQLVLAVLNVRDGCERPVVVRRDVGRPASGKR